MTEEQERFEQELIEHRINEQKQNNDYDINFAGEIETCDDCGARLNSHGWCPRCDY